MTEFINFNKALLNSIKDTLTGGEEAQKNFLLRQKLKGQAYQALLKLWGEVVRKLNENETEQFDNETAFQEVLLTFHNEMLAVYEQFEDGMSYHKAGLLENIATKAGEIFHKNVFAGSDSFKKEIEYEFEQFWSNFFRLKGCDLLKNEKGQMEVLQESIIVLGSRSIKTAIASKLEWQNNQEIKTKPPETNTRGFNIKAALEKELSQTQSLFIEVNEAKKYADLIEQNIGKEWIKFLATELAKTLGNGRMLQLNSNYSTYLNTTFIIGNAYATYLCGSDYKILYYLIKEGGRHQALIEKHRNDFEGPAGIKILNDQEDANFLQELLNACQFRHLVNPEHEKLSELLSSNEGMMYAVLTKVRMFNDDLNLADNNTQKIADVIMGYLVRSKGIHDSIQNFNASLAGIDVEKEFVDILRTQHRPDLYRLWLNKPFWANDEEDLVKSKDFLFDRLGHSYQVMQEMSEKSKQNIEGEETQAKERDELSQMISDESVTSIAYMIIAEFEDQLLWFLNNTTRIELEMRRREILGDIVKWIAESVSRQFKNSLYYRLILITNEENISGDAKAEDWRNRSLKILSWLASNPEEGKPLVTTDITDFKEVNDLYSARAYVDHFIKENNIETKYLSAFCAEFQETMKLQLIKTLLVQFIHYFPDNITSIELDENINYDLTTFNGVLGEFIRNIAAIAERKENLTA